MPPILDDTVAGPDANTWADLDYYKGYLETRVPAPSWLAAALSGDLDDQLAVDLIQSGRLFNIMFVWTGIASTSGQAMTWPRKNMYTVNGFPIPENVNPNALKDAQCEYGVQLRGVGAKPADLLSDNIATKKNVKRVKASSVEVEFQDTDVSSLDLVDASIQQLTPELLWTRVPDAVRALLVPSWYVRETVVTVSRRESVFRVF